jgi:hypothetical protein
MLSIADPVVAQKVAEDRQRHANWVLEKDSALQALIKR